MKNPVSDKNSDRIIRGGYWSYIASYSRVSFRSSNGPTYRFGLGFRIVRNAPKDNKS